MQKLNSTIQALRLGNDIITILSMIDLLQKTEEFNNDVFKVIEAKDREHKKIDSLLNIADKMVDFAETNEKTIIESFFANLCGLKKAEEPRPDMKKVISDADFIDTSNLEIGMMIKNYKNLCQVLDLPILEGNSKKAQINNIHRYVDLQKIKGSQKMIVAEIYEEPLAKIDGREKGNRSIYVNYIEIILMNYLAKQKNFTCTMTKNKIWLLLGMVNSNYGKISMKDLQNLNYCITPFQINHFYQRCNSRLTNILQTALDNLKKRCILDYIEQTVIVDLNNHYFLASDENRKNILAVKKQVLKEMGLESITQVYLLFRGNEFFDRVNSILTERYDWKFTFNQYKMIYNNPDVVEEIPILEEELRVKIENNKQQLNDTVAEALIKGANKHYNSKADRLPDFYCEAQHMLTDELIRIKNRKRINFEEDMQALDALFSCFD